jgi:L-fuculose-phosphate aldolase
MEQSWVELEEQCKEAVQAVAESSHAAQPEASSPLEAALLFEAEALREEIILVGRKLWERQYVDGNGGNISARLGSRYVLCTPTLVSKGDMEPADICLSDLDGNILAGDRARTSELPLHLGIYKANPRARAVVHCHPPYATAFAVTGTVPPSGLITEYEIFIGQPAVAPYETPGTQAFADTVLPFVQEHNTILLQNHGVVCWSDTVTRAEHLAEILDAGCKTYLVAKQIGAPLNFIPEDKIREILALKRRLGLPDARFRLYPELAGSPTAEKSAAELDRLVEQVKARLQARE